MSEIVLSSKKIKRLEELRQLQRMHDGDTSEGNYVNALIDLIKKHLSSNFTICEIGSYRGVSSEVFAIFLEKVFCVDCWEGWRNYGDRHPLEPEEEFDVMSENYENIVKFKMRSVEASKLFENESIDAIYIDGDHQCPGFSDDMNNWIPKIKKEGYIIGHDWSQISDCNRIHGWMDPSKVEIFRDDSWIIKKKDLNKKLSNKIMKEELIDKFLTSDPRTGSEELDNRDLPEDWDWSIYSNYQNFTNCNKTKLLDKLLSLNLDSGVIVEIGVSRNKFEDTSTYILTKYKKNNTIYLGIDIEDKSFLEEKFENTHTLISRSEDYTKVIEKFLELGITEIDFLFIDGWHSINQVIDELFWVQMVRPGGIIGYHDTNNHPGPSKIISLFKPELFEVERCCQSPLDWGVSFAKKLK